MENKPIIGITIGEPAGIGSEIAIKLLSDNEIYKIGRPLIIGSKVLIEEGLRINKVNLACNEVQESKIREHDYHYGMISYLNMDNVTLDDFDYGKISGIAGKAAGEFFEKAIYLALDKIIDAIVTCPINKESFTLGGWGKKYAGHTEMIADYTGISKYSMMLAKDNLRTIHVSTHVSLKQAIENCKKDRVLDVIELAHLGCTRLGIKNPKIAVCGLNPHAGEEGLFGDEELNEIKPAIIEAIANGMDVSGPLPADTLYCKAKGGQFDIVVAMYHDQGHIPLKYAGFIYNDENKKWDVRGINTTVGLPIIRVSVDHGTAFGKAGKGTADYLSLKDAYLYAVKFALSSK